MKTQEYLTHLKLSMEYRLYCFISNNNHQFPEEHKQICKEAAIKAMTDIIKEGKE